MTLPTGFPDWQNTPAWHARAIQPATTVILPNTTITLDERDVGNFGSITYHFKLNSGAIRIRVYAEVAVGAISPRETHRFIMGTETEIFITIPVRSSAIKVTVDGAPAGNSEIDYAIFVSNTGVQKTTYWGPLDHFVENGAVLTPGAIIEHYPPYLLPGPAYLSFQSTGAVGIVDVQVRAKGLGATPEKILTRTVPTTNTWDMNFIIPATRWCVRVQNNDVVNQNYGFGVVSSGAVI